MIEAWRLLAVLDVVALFAAGLYLHLGHLPHLPRVLREAGFVFGGVLVLVALSVFANALTDVPPTLGVKVFAIGAGALAAAAGWLCVQAARGRR